MSISVVIPSYNHSEYVLEAIESVLAQNIPDLDLIVIDDGSRDGSLEKLRDFHRASGGFRLVLRPNAGLIRTLNEGLHLARGEFFCELASDDYLPPGSLEARLAFLRTHPECIAVFGDGFIVRGTTLTTERLLDAKRRRMLAASDPIPEMLAGALPVFSTGLFRTSPFQQMGGFDEVNFRYYEDLDTPIRLALAGKFGFIDAPVICRREHGLNVSTATSHVRVEKVLCYVKLLKEPAMRPYRRQVRNRVCRSLMSLGKHLSSTGNATAAEREVLQEGWRYVWQEPRLIKYLWKWGRAAVPRR